MSDENPYAATMCNYDSSLHQDCLSCRDKRHFVGFIAFAVFAAACCMAGLVLVGMAILGMCEWLSDRTGGQYSPGRLWTLGLITWFCVLGPVAAVLDGVDKYRSRTSIKAKVQQLH